MEHNTLKLHNIATLYWHPGCTVHCKGGYESRYFKVALHMDVVAWKILTYSVWFYKNGNLAPNTTLIDQRHPYRFWLWQSRQRDATVIRAVSGRPVSVDFDAFTPVSVYRRLASAKLTPLTDRLLKGFYDLNGRQLSELYNPARITEHLLPERIERAIAYANGDAERPRLSADGDHIDFARAKGKYGRPTEFNCLA